METSARTRVATIRQLIDADCYVVSAGSVAEVIVARMAVRRLVAATTFRNDLQPAAPPVRSFRLDERAPSFRACRPRGRVPSRR